MACGRRGCSGRYPCNSCSTKIARAINGDDRYDNSGGTFHSTSFRDKPQRDDPSVTNTYFNSGAQDGGNHGHVKYRDNPDGTTDYLYARDAEGNVYDV